MMGIWNGEGWGGEVSSRATWDRGGQDSTTQKEGFQVSKRELARGIGKGELAREIGKGLHLNLVLLICVHVS